MAVAMLSYLADWFELLVWAGSSLLLKLIYSCSVNVGAAVWSWSGLCTAAAPLPGPGPPLLSLSMCCCCCCCCCWRCAVVVLEAARWGLVAGPGSVSSVSHLQLRHHTASRLNILHTPSDQLQSPGTASRDADGISRQKGTGTIPWPYYHSLGGPSI